MEDFTMPLEQGNHCRGLPDSPEAEAQHYAAFVAGARRRSVSLELQVLIRDLRECCPKVIEDKWVGRLAELAEEFGGRAA